jgi:hydroxyacylglutathione hydrolase
MNLKRFVVGFLGTNCYLLYEKSSRQGLLIDPGEYDPDIKAFIDENSIDVIGILNTHCHADHIMGNSAFGYPVMIHELDEPGLTDPSKNLSSLSVNGMAPLKAGRILADGDVIELGGKSLKVIHTPGHSPGGISVLVGDMLFSGDTLFFEGVGRTDLPGGDQDALISSIRDKLYSLPDNVRVFPGHGPETTIGHEKANNPYV